MLPELIVPPSISKSTDQTHGLKVGVTVISPIVPAGIVRLASEIAAGDDAVRVFSSYPVSGIMSIPIV